MESGSPASTDFFFDEDAAQRVVDFYELFLTHFEGSWAGKPFTLDPWEYDVVWNVFGWKKLDGFRRYNKLYIEIPRKNGKSTFAGGLGVYLTGFDGEPGAQVYSAANDKEQARIVFGYGKTMIEKSPHLSPHFDIVQNAIVHPGSMSSWKVLSSESKTKDGFNIHGIVIDELHALTDRTLYDVLTTASGARDQPLTAIITTAGQDKESICYEEHEYARKVIEGIQDDPSLYAKIYAAGKDDDWRRPETWKKANPNFGVSLKPEYYETELRKALVMPSKEASFKRLYLNIWGESDEKAISSGLWNSNEGWNGLEEKTLAGRKSYWGLDLASVGDIAALVGVFPQKFGPWRIICRFFCPEDRIAERSRRGRAPYDLWVKAGLMIATPGNSIDFNRIEREIVEVSKAFEIVELGYDRWNAAQIVTNLQGEGIKVVPFGMGFASMNAPAKHFEKMLLDYALWHGGHPVLRWMAGNLVWATDAAENIKPDKEKSREKIDGITALLMGIGRAIVQPELRSVYETRGIVQV